MRCTQCDNQLQPGARFCAICGQPVAVEPPTMAMPAPGAYPPPPAVGNGHPSPQGSGNNNLLYGIIALLVAVVAIVGVFLLYTVTHDGKVSQSKTTQRAENSKVDTEKSEPRSNTEKESAPKTEAPQTQTPKKAAPKKTAPVQAPAGRVRSLGAFQTASGNIHCMVADYLRCDLSQNDAVIPPKPADCDLDYGNAFQMEFAAGGGERICHGDTVNNPSNPVLAYGDKNVVGAFTCESTQAALICTTDSGGYMKLSRQSQTLHGAQ